LAPLKVKRLVPHFDDSEFRTNALTGDYTTESLDAVLDKDDSNELVVQTYLELASKYSHRSRESKISLTAGDVPKATANPR
jgi:hypothetical protein